MNNNALSQIRDRFREFPRPRQVVVHDPNPSGFDPSIHCVDCPWVSESLDLCDCDSLYFAREPFFNRIALDCLNVDAFLHFLPAMFKQSFGAEGQSISETLIWIFGVDAGNWDADQTISQQMAPRLNELQIESVRDFLVSVKEVYQLSPYCDKQLNAAISIWNQLAADRRGS